MHKSILCQLIWLRNSFICLQTIFCSTGVRWYKHVSKMLCFIIALVVITLCKHCATAVIISNCVCVTGRKPKVFMIKWHFCIELESGFYIVGGCVDDAVIPVWLRIEKAWVNCIIAISQSDKLNRIWTICFIKCNTGFKGSSRTFQQLSLLQ